jgi:predicted HAD superfamily Cof-like phosphohydrolase
MTESARMARVREFHEKYNCAIAAEDTPELRLLRARLVLEEAIELSEALIGTGSTYVAIDDLIQARRGLVPSQPLEVVAKEMADLDYVNNGGAVSLDIDLDEACRRVHESNMTKTPGPNYKHPGGKVTKGPNYVPPDMTGVVHPTPRFTVEWAREVLQETGTPDIKWINQIQDLRNASGHRNGGGVMLGLKEARDLVLQVNRTFAEYFNRIPARSDKDPVPIPSVSIKENP